MLRGYADRLKMDRRGQAWTVSHLLVAAGCDPNKVTVAKLLGEKEPKRKPETAKKPIDEIFALMTKEGGNGKD